MDLADHILAILEGFEDHDGVIREVKTDDIVKALAEDLDPVYQYAPELLEATKAFADLMEDPADYPDEMFECFVEVKEVKRAHDAIALATGLS